MASIFIPNIYCDSTDIEESAPLSDVIKTYIDEQFAKKTFETFPDEDIFPQILPMIYDLQNEMESCVKSKGGQISILSPPKTNVDAVNKEYVDWLYSDLKTQLATKINSNSDMDINHFKIKNVPEPKDYGDAVNKNYVDEKLSHHHLISKGHCHRKKTYFFNPGFICPSRLNVVSVGFSTSAQKIKVDNLKNNDLQPHKLYFVVNNDIKSEIVIEKDQQVGYILKEFDDPIVLNKKDNVMLVVDSLIEDASVNICFY